MSVLTTRTRPPEIRRRWRHLPVLVLVAALGLTATSASARGGQPG